MAAVESRDCPVIRALTFDVLGLIKAIQSSYASTSPKIVETWGHPDSSNSILSASLNDSKFNPLLAVARKNGHIELVNPLNGDIHSSRIIENGVEDPIVALHLFKKDPTDSLSRECTLVTCTRKGNAALRSLEVDKTPSEDSTCNDSVTTWNVCSSGEVLCSAVHGNESQALFGGKGVEVNLWDLETRSKTWSSKAPPKSSLGIFTPTCFTAATFLNKEDHHKIVAGTDNHQVRLYDISAQRRPVISVDFREAPIKAVTEDIDGHTIYIGTGSGDLASIDIRTGKLLGCFLGKCSGSIRSIVRHPEIPLIVSVGLDRYLRVWDVKTRQLLSAVFLKQHLTNVVIDSNFSDLGTTGIAVDALSDEAQLNQNEVDASPPVKRKKGDKKLKSKKKSKKIVEEEDD
ncbi:hypothetical protein IFM89_034671 [Coptis chinensis]|uniref:Uncharacterized protein n=1 Tax=Coptis chinensis TaxID=261450 RepID=A0A835LSK8_9MAGN|nr:hypothetical protein IFM89_034671 [Coptis chinensis]